MEVPNTKSPVLLIATEGEWAGRSMESVLERHGYSILRAEDGRDALGRALQHRPDALILDEHLSGIGGIEVCQLLREDSSFDLTTPIIITAAAPAPRAVQAAAYRAGAWEFRSQPLDIDTLLLQLSTFLRARSELAKQRELALVDAATGVLTPEGMERWAEKLAARASRNHESLACVVLTPVLWRGDKDASSSRQGGTVKSVADFLRVSRDNVRRSDVVGRTADGRLALLAPETDAEGVERMLARLRAAMAAPDTPVAYQATELRAGYWAAQDFASTPLEAPELMRRAMRAHDHLSEAPHDKLAIGFDQIPMS